MEVRITTAISGTIDGEPWPSRGTVVDLDDDVAADIVSAGVAEVVENADAVPAEAAEVPAAATTEAFKPETR